MSKKYRSPGVLPSEITPESVYEERRQLIKGVAGGLIVGLSGAPLSTSAGTAKTGQGQSTSNTGGSIYSTKENMTPLEDITKHNNFYEFGVDKSDPFKYSSELNIKPWSIAVEGEVERPGVYDLEDIVGPHNLEERIYRLRCVEAWSMVVPWLGFSLSSLIDRLKPTSRAKYVFFETLYRPSEFRGQRSKFSSIKWPYVEGLRIDEALNPLAFMAVGLYGKELPNQNGAPIRLVVPWKYGFKSIKSIVKIKFVKSRKLTSWESIAPGEYGFYANVNPNVDHPRWSQKIERRLPSTLFDRNTRKTEIFNGYGEYVAHLYSGMDLQKNY